ncbi:MAG: acetyl-CoA carboxylase biotin carboxyl carrier protein subunit [Prevotellaceae bacterium]|jgi:biotin carboxyl carrier protein|nr:acetyl-CoA carboxylase biotin carboxyl carrier protein subunit [Prevotellaceae bacterium]
MEIKVGDRIADVELISKEDNMVKIRIDDTIFDVDIVMAENGLCSILHEGKSYNAELKRAENGKEYQVNTYFSSFLVQIIDAQSKYQQNRQKDSADEQQSSIISQMPGKVVKILVKEGEKVKAGQSIIVIEAMKMQNEYKVQQDCVVERIYVAEGDSVAGGQLLIKLSSTENEE